MDISNIISRIEESLMPIVPFIKQYWDVILALGVLWTGISLLLIAFSLEDVEKEYCFEIVYHIFKSKTDLNLFGRIVMVLLTIPGWLLVDLHGLIYFLLTWHPLKKDAE